MYLLSDTAAFWGALQILLYHCHAQQNNNLLRLPLQKISHNLDRRNLQNADIPIFDETTDHDGLHRGIGTHYVTFHVGCSTEPQPQTVIVDTGSGRTGFPCSSCVGECGQGYHLNPSYQVNLSDCFVPNSCEDCSCDSNQQCRVSVRYVEGSQWSGYRATDQVRIGSPNEDPVSVDFVCQDKITNLFLTQLADGITGLSKAPSSLMNQMYRQGKIGNRQFSLCMLHVHQPEDSAGLLVLGGTDVRLHSSISPMAFAKDMGREEKWQVQIQKIYLTAAGNKDVPFVNSSSNDKTNNETAVVSLRRIPDNWLRPIVDSGTTSTYLHNFLEAPMRNAWNQLVPALDFQSGMYISSEEQAKGLPTFWFQLQSEDSPGALVAFPPSAYLVPVQGDDDGARYQMRMYFTSSSAVFGANWMTGHDVLFDDENGRIGFAPSDCVLQVNATHAPVPSASNGKTSPLSSSLTSSSTVVRWMQDRVMLGACCLVYLYLATVA